MLTPGVLNDGEKLEYASGLAISDYRGLRKVSHGGAFVGYRAQLIRFPDQRLSVICLCIACGQTNTFKQCPVLFAGLSVCNSTDGIENVIDAGAAIFIIHNQPNFLQRRCGATPPALPVKAEER